MNPLEKSITSMKKNGFFGFLFLLVMDLLKYIHKKLAYHRDWSSKFQLIENSSKKECLIIVLAGYKDRLWPITLERIKKFSPNNADVCILTAGKHRKDIEIFCTQNRWSYLTTKKNKTGVALNKSIAAHPNAKWIYKLDEDIFITEGFFDKLKEGFEKIESEKSYIPGFCAPVLNVNGVSYRTFLKTMNLEAAYKEKFQELLISCGDIHAHKNPEAAKWIWEHSLPLQKVSQIFDAQGFDFEVIPIRFSIGAILFKRDFWQECGGFQSAFSNGTLGIDEEFFCKNCINKSRPMFIIKNVFAGHFSFFPQEEGMLKFLPQLHKLDKDSFKESMLDPKS